MYSSFQKKYFKKRKKDLKINLYHQEKLKCVKYVCNMREPR